MKKLSEPVITDQAHPKYRIGELLRKQYGELKVKEGVIALSTHCGLKQSRRISDWMNLEAGSSNGISHLVLEKVLSFFDLQTEAQLQTAVHKQLLKAKTIENV